jgi:hypothetical protein
LGSRPAAVPIFGFPAYPRGTDEPLLPTPRFDDPAAIAALGARLAEAGYTAAGLEESLGGPAAQPTEVLSRRLAGESPRNTLVRLFYLGEPVSAESAGSALQGLEFERLQEMGVLAATDGDIRAELGLVPHRDILVAYERGAAPREGSELLANMTARMHFASALDVSVGPALHALLAARHTDRVVAIVPDERAAALTGFAARLNGLGNVECRVGERLEPVAGHSFGLVTANPDCLVSPDLEERGDSLCRELVQGIAAHLSEGGFAHILAGWLIGAGEDWWSPLESWVSGVGCDAWLLLEREEDPIAHAGARTKGDDIDRWIAYLRDLAADRLASGALVLRRRSRGSNWVRHEVMPTSRIGPAGDQVVRAFVNHDLLVSTPDQDELLEEVLAIVEPQRIEETWRHQDEGLELESARARLEWGFGFSVGVDRYTIELLARVDGRRRLRELFAEIATDSQLEEDVVARAGLPAVRRLLELGFLARA